MASSKKRRSPVLQRFESDEQVRADTEVILRVEDRKRLLEALSSDPELFAAPDPMRARAAEVGAAIGLDSDVIWAALRLFDWLCRNLPKPEIEAFVEELIRLGFASPREDEALYAFFDKAIDFVRPAVLRRWRVASITRAFQGVDYACDLRLDVSDPEEGDSQVPVPLCVVRIRTDEGEPFVFQCMSVDLSRLIEAFEDAKKRLSNSFPKA